MLSLSRSLLGFVTSDGADDVVDLAFDAVCGTLCVAFGLSSLCGWRSTMSRWKTTRPIKPSAKHSALTLLCYTLIVLSVALLL